MVEITTSLGTQLQFKNDERVYVKQLNIFTFHYAEDLASCRSLLKECDIKEEVGKSGIILWTHCMSAKFVNNNNV
jgi:hypothetical protein